MDMKKLLYVLIALTLIAGKCKKEEPGTGGGEEPQTYECLPDELVYTDHQDDSENETTKYYYNGNAIDKKKRTFSDDSYLTYRYVYQNKEKGLLDRINIMSGNSVIAKIMYTLQDEKTMKRELYIMSMNSTAWEIFYTYNADGKVATMQIKDYDLWDRDEDGVNEPTDETAVLTYTGDNVTNIKWYNTADMNTITEEYDYEYDQGKRAFDNVVTQTFPSIRVNNVTKITRNVYGNNPKTEITIVDIVYNNKGFPVKYVSADDRNNLMSTQDITYNNCD